MTPRVSVVMPVYNGERYVREAVESALAQSLRDIEVVVIDDGSTDSSPAIVARLARDDPRVVIGNTLRVGQAEARNRAIAMARAELIAFLDHDDVAYPNRLQRQCAYLDSHERVALVGGALTFINDEGARFAEDIRYPLTPDDVREAFARMTPVLTSAGTLRRSAFEAAGGFRRLFADSEDLDLWLRIAERHDIANLPDTVVGYRIHAGQGSAQRLEQQSMTALAARISARARAEGRDDPAVGLDHVDRDVLVALGATDEQIARSFVIQATWLAKALQRSGAEEHAQPVFDAAVARARSAGSDELVAYVELERSRVEGGERRGLRARVRSLLSR